MRLPGRPIRDLTGQKFGMLRVISRAENGAQGQARWRCICECQNETVVLRENLLKAKSCGCRKGHHTHGLTKHPLFRTWAQIGRRCNKSTSTDYKWYGGRGVRRHPYWDKFEVFFEDVLPLYEKAKKDYPLARLTVDRIDSNGHYELHNIRFIPKEDQSKNRRPAGDTTRAHERFIEPMFTG